jgi:hypothetical protein
MIFTDSLESSAFCSGEEYAWQRADALRAVESIAAAELAMLGGEVWLVVGDTIQAAVPQVAGATAIEHWVCDRREGEAWHAYVARSAREASEAIRNIPDLSRAVLPDQAIVYYNIVWASEADVDSR